MGKFALLIGVGEYQSSELKNLRAAILDIQEIQKVLIDPEIGGFAKNDVDVLPNPEPQQMREAIERLFSDRRKDDLLLLYFSGHGIANDFGNFYFTSAITQTNRLDSTAIPATFVHRLMEGSKSQRQVVILDACVSGAFAKGMNAKGETVNLEPQLGGKGRAVLTSSSATEFSFEQKDAALSVYTEYIVEGLRTGIADRNGDGLISIDELHEFAKEKVREVSPAMQPRIYAVEEGYKIVFSKAPIGDPKLAYRKEVEKLARERNGELSKIVLMGLETKQKHLELSDLTAAEIRQEVLRPHQEFAKKLQQYKRELQKVRGMNSQITEQCWKDLLYFQKSLGLTDQNVEQMLRGVKVLQKPPLHKQVKPLELPLKSGSKTTSLKNKLLSFSQGILIMIGISGLFLGLVQNKEWQSVQSPSIDESTQVAQDWLDKGKAKDSNGDYVGAIEDYDKAIELKPKDAVAYIFRGSSRHLLGNHQGAIEDYDKAIELKPDYAEAYFNRGNSRSNLNHTKDAIEDYTKAIAFKSDGAETYLARGNSRRKREDYRGSIEDYGKAIELKPNYTEAYFNRGDSHSKLKNYRSSIEDYDKVIAFKPDYAEAYINRGDSRSNSNDNKGAIEDCTRAIELQPEFALAYYNRAVFRYSSDDKKNAIADYKKAADIYQKQGEIQDYQDTLAQIKKLQ